MDTRKQGALGAFARTRGITVVAGKETTFAEGVLVYDATGAPMESRWALARGLAHASGEEDPERLAEHLFASA